MKKERKKERKKEDEIKWVARVGEETGDWERGKWAKRERGGRE
jgi:hypothetical protein